MCWITRDWFMLNLLHQKIVHLLLLCKTLRKRQNLPKLCAVLVHIFLTESALGRNLESNKIKVSLKRWLTSRQSAWSPRKARDVLNQSKNKFRRRRQTSTLTSWWCHWKGSPPSRSRRRLYFAPPKAWCTQSPNSSPSRKAMSSSAQSARRELSKRHKLSAVICPRYTLASQLISLGNSWDARSVSLTESASSEPRSYTLCSTAQRNIFPAPGSNISKICWDRKRRQRIAASLSW